MKIGIGIDTGGTCTDAVLYDLDSQAVIAKSKALTTKDSLEIGIMHALDSLPIEQLRQAKVLTLSTTLATNACVEGKGARTKLILLGTSEKTMEWVDAPTRYGLQKEDVLCIEEATDQPSWQCALADAGDWLADAQALAVAGKDAALDGGALENTVKTDLQASFDVPVVTGHDISGNRNVLERGATAMVNARLLPVIDDFIKAIKTALAKRGLHMDEMIVRSDGSSMSEKLALQFPVHTILSGPAASVIGAVHLTACDNCLIVDMGGTTTDISLVKNGVPLAEEHIAVGGYRTQVSGVYMETFGLGGDSRITAEKEHTVLHARRVEPLCIAAEKHPAILPQLKKLADEALPHTVPLHELLYLVKKPQSLLYYTESEQQLIKKLEDHPILLGSRELDIYNLHTQRLEDEGVIMRAGLTPTDIMHIRGDFSTHNREAALLGATYVMKNIPAYADGPIEAFCDHIYDLVCRKMYVNIVRILLRDKYPLIFGRGFSSDMEQLIAQSWTDRETPAYFQLDFRSQAALVCAGAPTHLFLPKVAQALHAPCLIPDHAEVTNAIGAVTSSISAKIHIQISPVCTEESSSYIVHSRKGDISFDDRDKAIRYAEKEALELAAEEARHRGALGELETAVSHQTHTVTTGYGSEIEMDTVVTAVAKGRQYS